MLCLDTNVLVHAFRIGSPIHDPVRSWLANVLDGDEPVIVPVDVGAAFMRLSTNARLFPDSTSAGDALEFVHEVESAARFVSASPWAWSRFLEFVSELALVGNDVPDALIAAQALDHGATLATFGQGFARFSELQVLDLSRFDF
jgi:toxin-antitoxin system PIN domain toxin